MGRARFGPFELDVKAGELRTADRRVKLQRQPFQIPAVANVLMTIDGTSTADGRGQRRVQLKPRSDRRAS